MGTPLFFPVPKLVPKLGRSRLIPLREVCKRAGVACKASGAWTERPIAIVRGNELSITAEPGSWGAVRIEVPRSLSNQEAARLALGALAYRLMDTVARESIRGADWAKPAAPKGRPKAGTALNSRERQRRHRAKHF